MDSEKQTEGFGGVGEWDRLAMGSKEGILHGALGVIRN